MTFGTTLVTYVYFIELLRSPYLVSVLIRRTYFFTSVVNLPLAVGKIHYSYSEEGI